MKKKKNIFLIIFLCLFLSLAVTMHADSGWDGDYDSGSSWDGGGSDWDWGSSSSNHDWGSSNRHDRVDSADDLGSAFLIMGIFFTICIVITVAILTTTKNKNNQNRINNNNIAYDLGLDINKIKEIIPGFDANEFRTATFDIYMKIQIAWMNFDYDTLKTYTTNELYNLYKSELIALKAKKQKNIMENFSLLNFTITDIEKGTDEVSIKVRMNVMCKDYVVDVNNNVVRGNKNRMIMYDYEMTFTKGLSTKDNKCPNCNAPLDNVQTSTCPYCNSTIISDNHDWVLSKKQVKSQR